PDYIINDLSEMVHIVEWIGEKKTIEEV
ncbi:hypothetical protein Q604_UNBc4C00284G0001, partial [human gut metagenome]